MDFFEKNEFLLKTFSPGWYYQPGLKGPNAVGTRGHVEGPLVQVRKQPRLKGWAPLVPP